MTKPTVTFALFAFNQERFVREAVEGAFAQSYKPIEIILSDDCSKDRTFEIMEQAAAKYRGPHKVILNRNPTNAGLSSHINRVMQLATGELIVAAAGDDISLANRAEIVVDQFVRSAGRATSIYSSAILIDDGSDEIGRFIEPLNHRCKTDLVYRVAKQAPGLHGASHTWHRKLFDEFGPLNLDVVAEDRVLAFRSFEIGEVVAIDRELIKYRVHDSNVWFRVSSEYDRDDHIRRTLTRAKARESNFRQFLTDMEHPIFARNHSAEELSEARRIAEKNMRLARIEQEFVSASRLRRPGVIARGLVAGNSVQKSVKWMARTVLPESVYYDYVIRSNRVRTQDLALPGSADAD